MRMVGGGRGGEGSVLGSHDTLYSLFETLVEKNADLLSGFHLHFCYDRKLRMHLTKCITYPFRFAHSQGGSGQIDVSLSPFTFPSH